MLIGESMQIIPAMDILNGNVVRLRQGEEDTSVIYSRDPVKTALAFQKDLQGRQ